MRLIHGKTLRLVEFTDNHIPPYAILSHTWGAEEITFQEMSKDFPEETRPPLPFPDKGQSFRKIEYCCSQASRDGFEYSWVDTCCIDKSSSSELSEAINSMFRWYSNAAICYAYLSDVHVASDQMFLSRWFTRGWTLQELLAPKSVQFFSSTWEFIGSKQSLSQKIANTTGIDEATLLNPTALSSASVARRMAWAAKRQTSRTEDVAYCLMGLFDVNMPLLYGEGEKAFIRLQEEIIKENDDHSLLAWEYSDPNENELSPGPQSLQPEGSESENRLFGVLATHPSAFKGCHAIRSIPTFTSSMTMTNKGLQITLPVMGSSSSTISGILNCYFDHDSKLSSRRPSHIALPLRVSYKGDGSFDRRPRFGRMLVLEKDAAKASLKTLNLTKRDASISSGRSMLFVLEDEDRLGVVLKKTIFTVKTPVIPELDTVYRSWQLPLTTITFPTGLADYIAAFEFSCTHSSVEKSTFCVLIESRRAQQLWSTSVLFHDSEADLPLETILNEKAGTFQNEGKSIAYDTGLKNRPAIGMRVRVDFRTSEMSEMLVTVSSTQKFIRTNSEEQEYRSSVRSMVNKFRMRTVS